MVISKLKATEAADELAEQAGDHLREYDRNGIGDACRNCGRTAHFEVEADNSAGYERYCAECLAILHGEESQPPSGRFIEEIGGVEG